MTEIEWFMNQPLTDKIGVIIGCILILVIIIRIVCHDWEK